MGASAHIGRVGGLAVALGVGAAVATGHGVAWADTQSGSSTSGSSASSGADSSSSGASSSDASASGASSSGASTSASATGTAKSGATTAGGAKSTPSDPDESDDAETTGAVKNAVDLDKIAAAFKRSERDGDETDAAPGETEPETVPEAEVVPESAPPAENETAVQPTAQRGVPGGGHSVAEQDALSTDRDAVTTTNFSTRTMNVTTTGQAADSAGIESAAAESVTDETNTSAAQTVFTALNQAAESAEGLFAITMSSPTPEAADAPILQRVAVNLLSTLGIGALASGVPSAPVWSPFAMALLALGSRREFTEPVTAQTKTVGTAPTAELTAPEAAAAAVAPTYPGTTRIPVSISGNTQFIEFVTGPGNLNNTITRFGIGGTDLGIMWDNGIEDDPTTAVDEHQVLIAFGDTFSNANPVRTGVWRFNTLFRSADDVLNNGLYVPNGRPYDIFSGSPMENANWSDPILPSPGQPVHPPYAVGPEVTIIPTAGVSVPYDNEYGARQYMSFMSIRSWDTPGRWTTNYSGIAYSDDNGQTWRIAPTSIRTAAAGRATVPYVSGNDKFQQMAFVKPPEGSPDAEQGWVYAYGTPSGRAGTVYLSRVQETQIMDTTKYQYWDGANWVVNKPSVAKPILPGKTTSFFGFFKQTTYPSASEMSVQYNEYLGKYVMVYGDGNNQIVLRTADSPQGPWNTPTVLVSPTRMPSLYAPFIHPWSGTDNLPESEQHYLYWNLSTYNDYQVRLMRTDLDKIKV